MTESGCPVNHEGTPKGSGCPVDHGQVDPRNNIPHLTQDQSPGQTQVLPTERTTSSIPRPEGTGAPRWEYPSPQQFFNALMRKGKPAPEEFIESMVDIHNFLNEECWNEVLKWETLHPNNCPGPYLTAFRGRPQELSPKARFFTLFGSERPFDRHDWTVSRCGKDIRYVIDYYSAPDTPEGDPVFHVDVRPAIDSPSALVDRARMAWKEWREGN